MNLSLYIKNIFIESCEVDTSHAVLLSQRERIVKEFSEYFQRKYYKDLLLAVNWEIVLTAQSKLNDFNIIRIAEICEQK